ncbi:hypothetical protein K6119_18005 [Paracrocinitomix mangrovi]|uniref:hypothetical protein n=1 Tax=Paracrocinitomix mangrovi TaxID=2862509 RepID=UPI001C8F06E9|nr:hypothetical protein [Paracrocinitomix mangrovi]UKN01619.1 hypothetical protein K6119_18005 [Paracrocinitomix mangrovi]
METKVVFVERRRIKDVRLKIIQYLIQHGAFPDSIQFSPQQVAFRYSEEIKKDDRGWCDELNQVFKGDIDFLSKYSERF